MYAAHAHGNCSQFQNNLADNKFRQERRGTTNLTKKLLFHRKNCNKKISQYIYYIQIEARQETLKSARPCLPAPTWIALCQLFSSAFSFSYIQKSNYRRLGYYHLELVGRDQTIESWRLEGGSHQQPLQKMLGRSHKIR